MNEETTDSQAILDQCAMECIEAIEAKDKERFRDAFSVLVGDILSRMQMPETKESSDVNGS